MRVRERKKFDWDEYYDLRNVEDRSKYLKECYPIKKVRYFCWCVQAGDEKPTRAGKKDGYESIRDLKEDLKEFFPMLKSGRDRCWVTKEEVVGIIIE